MSINRGTTILPLTIANGAAVSDAFDMQRHAGGTVLMPAAWTAASIGFQVAATEAGTYYKLYDADGNLVQIVSPSASLAYAMPTELFGAAFVKLWSQDGSGNNTNQGAERAPIVILKS